MIIKPLLLLLLSDSSFLETMACALFDLSLKCFSFRRTSAKQYRSYTVQDPNTFSFWSTPQHSPFHSLIASLTFVRRYPFRFSLLCIVFVVAPFLAVLVLRVCVIVFLCSCMANMQAREEAGERERERHKKTIFEVKRPFAETVNACTIEAATKQR